jgi:HEAT repeat protein
MLDANRDPNDSRLARRRRVEGKTFDGLASELHALSLEPGNEQARLAVMGDLAALCEINPEACQMTAARVRSPQSKLDADVLLGALSSADSPAALSALSELAANQDLEPSLRNSALTHLALHEAPTEETFDTLKQVASGPDPDLAGTATYALGAAARHANDAADSGVQERARDTIRDLNARFDSAESAEDRSFLLGALGNAGDRSALGRIESALSDPDPRVRAAAAAALRFIAGPEPEALLARLMVGDPDPAVRRAALSAAAERAPSEVLLSAATSELLAAGEIDVRLEAIRVVARSLPDPKALDALDRVSQSDPSEDIQTAARQALSLVGRG